MSKPRFKVSLSDEEAIELLGKVNTSRVYRFSNKETRDAIRAKRDMLRQEQGEASSVMSARFKDGSLMTIDEYCDYYGIDRASVKSFKLVTHTAVPYYNIQSVNLDVNTKATPDLIQLASERITQQPHDFKPFTPIQTKENNLLVIDIADAHFGKLATRYETGEDYGIEIAKQRCYDGVKGIISRASKFDISRIMFVIGNDVLHYDNPKRTTTSGTPQDTDGMFYDMFNSALDTYINIINELRLTYEIDVVFNASNHDYMSGWMLARALSMYFHNADNVSVDDGIRHRKYYKFGNNLIGTNHGDGAKLDDLPLLMANEEPILWSETKYRYIYVHHIHHKQTYKFMSGKDFIGVTVEFLRSPSASDSWHHRNGYVGAKKAIEGYIHNYEDGQIARISHYF